MPKEEAKYEVDHPLNGNDGFSIDDDTTYDRHLNDDDSDRRRRGRDDQSHYNTDDDDDDRYRDGDSRYTDGDSRYTDDDSRYRDDDASRYTADDSRYTEDQSHDGDRRRRHGDDDVSQDNTTDHYRDDYDDNSNQDGGRRGRKKKDKGDRFQNEDDDDDADEDEFLKDDDCCKGCTDGCGRRCPCCRPCCNLFQKCCACLYPHGWYALLGQVLAVLAFIVTVMGYVSCYDAQEGDHNMSFVGQSLVTDRNNTYAGCLTWPHNHPPELDQYWKVGKIMDVVSMISGIVCVIWILTFACFRWAKVLRYILIALFLFTGCAAGLALLAFKSKLCETEPYHCNIVPAAVISGCAALNWFVCAFIIWHLQDPDDREDDFDDDEEDEDGDDDDDRVKKPGHRARPEVIVEDLPDGSRKITKIKKRRDGSEKITETIIPAEEINYQQQQVKPYPEPDSMLTPRDTGDEEDQDSEAASMVETFRDEYPDGDDGFVTGFKPEPYHVPVQHDPEQADAGGSREMHVEPEPEPKESAPQQLLLPTDDGHVQPPPSSDATPSVPDLLDDYYQQAAVEEPKLLQHDHSAAAPAAAPQPPDLLDDKEVAAAVPSQPNLLHHSGHAALSDDDNESKDVMFHDDEDDDDEDEDVANLLQNANQRSAPPSLPQLTSPDDFRLKADDYDNGIPLDPPTDPRLLAPAPRLDPPVRYSIDDDDDDDDGVVPEIV